MTVYFLNELKQWEIIGNIVYPLTCTLGIDEALDIEEISFYSNENFVNNTAIKIFRNEAYYYIIKDLKKENVNNKTLYTLSLIEPIEILRGFKIENCAFSADMYTFDETILRLFKLARFDGEYEPINISFLNPEFTFVSTTLFLALFEVGRVIDCIPYLDFNETTKKWVLKFQRLDAYNNYNYPISEFNNINVFENYTGEALAKSVFCDMTNVKVETFANEPQIGGYDLTTTDNTQTININNIGIETKYKIDKLDAIYLYGKKVLANPLVQNDLQDLGMEFDNAFIFKNNELTYYNIKTYIENGNEVIASQDSISVIILTKQEYDVLTENEKNNNNILYIYYDDQLIYLTQLSKLRINLLYSGLTGYVKKMKSLDNGKYELYSFFGDYENDLGTTHILDFTFFDALSQISYQFSTEQETIPILISNNSNYKNTVYYNQTSQKVNADRTARTLQTYIDNMKSGQRIVTGTFKNWIDIPKEGSSLQDNSDYYIVNSITITTYKNYYSATAQLVKEHAQRRNYMGASSDLQINAIPNENLVKRKYFKLIDINFSLTQPTQENAFNKDLALSVFENELHNYVYCNRFINSGYENYILIGYPTIFKAGTNILLNESAKNNYIWDIVLQNEIQVPYAYTKPNGANENSQIGLYKLTNPNDLNNYPYFTDYNSNNEIVIADNYDKDKLEIFDFTTQLSFSSDDLIIRDELVTQLFTNNFKFDNNYTIKFFDNKKIGRYDNLPTARVERTATLTKTTDNNIIKLNVNFTTVNTYFISFALCVGNTPLFIKNYNSLQNNLKSFTIYVKTTNNNAFDTGVYGKE